MISVAWTTRNDDHGKYLVERMQVAIDSLAEWRESGVDVELIVVEWNPPKDRPLLSDVILLPRCLPVRWYVVPRAVHRLYPNHEQFALWNHIGTNVGLRRARGDWVLATTHDILWSHQLAQVLAEEVFDEGSFYRAPRYDGWLSYEKSQGTLEHIAEMERGQVVRKDYSGEGFFSRSCGDFILMSRKRWEWMRGYPEWPINGIWLDGLIMHMAQVGGLRQNVIPAPAYHMNHTQGGLEIYNDLPHMPRPQYQRVCAEMLKSRRVPIVNDEGWGLGDAVEIDTLDGYRKVLTARSVKVPPRLWE